MVPGVGGIVKAGLSLAGISGPQKIDHSDIKEIADRYLLILELRSKNNEFIQSKFDGLKDSYAVQLQIYESKSKKGLGGLFR